MLFRAKSNALATRPFFPTFVKAFADNGSLDGEFVQRVEPDIAKVPPPSLKVEATENGQDVSVSDTLFVNNWIHPLIGVSQAYIDSKLSAETSFDDALAFLERTMDDVTNHTLISVAIKNVGVSSPSRENAS